MRKNKPEDYKVGSFDWQRAVIREECNEQSNESYIFELHISEDELNERKKHH